MYRVQWARAALDDLTTIWIDADSVQRQAVTLAAKRIESILSQDPSIQGESRAGNERVMFVAPLGVTFEIDATEQIVRISNCGGSVNGAESDCHAVTRPIIDISSIVVQADAASQTGPVACR